MKSFLWLICVVATAGAAEPDLSHVAPELRESARQVSVEFGSLKLSDESLGHIRELMVPTTAESLRQDVPVAEQRVPVPGGAPDVLVYLINARADGSRPAIVNVHGGGYVTGTAKGTVRYLQDLAAELDCVIATVEYRLAPETRYTGSIEDNYAALRWVHANAGKIGVDPARIAIMGESAGGGHAALLALTARDRHEVPVLLQVLIYPMLDDRTGSSRTVPAPIGELAWTAASNRFGWGSFLGQKPGTRQVPAAAVPARRNDLAGLAPAFIEVGGIDLFVEEDIDYARRLNNAGVPTELLVVPGAFHAFDFFAAQTDISQRFISARVAALRRAFAGTH